MSDNAIEVAYYYPQPYWASSETTWVKSLLLFFDQIAILLPTYMRGRELAADPTLAQPLEDRGLLQVLDPYDWLDQAMTERLATVVIGLLADGVFDELPPATHFAELSQSRLGFAADLSLSKWLVEELQGRGLARPSEDGVSVPLHPIVRTTILVLLGQLARQRGITSGLHINPSTSQPEAVESLLRLLDREPLPSAGHVVALDLAPVTLDLTTVPLDDVLAYRQENQAAHQTYMRDVRRFASDLAAITDQEEREAALLTRHDELADSGRELHRDARKAFGKNLAAWMFGIGGSWWSLQHGDPIGFALAALPAAAAAVPDAQPVGAYSYIFRAQHQLSWH